jgi:hypothetical protein
LGAHATDALAARAALCRRALRKPYEMVGITNPTIDLAASTPSEAVTKHDVVRFDLGRRVIGDEARFMHQDDIIRCSRHLLQFQLTQATDIARWHGCGGYQDPRDGA